MSLKLKLNLFIKDKGEVTLDEVWAFAQSQNAKQRTAERYLNEGVNKEVETLYNSKNQITGYKWKIQGNSSGVEQQTYKLSVDGSNPSSPTKCCTSNFLLGVCSRDCQSLKEKEKVGLW
jgi:hypothetical protein